MHGHESKRREGKAGEELASVIILDLCIVFIVTVCSRCCLWLLDCNAIHSVSGIATDVQMLAVHRRRGELAKLIMKTTDIRRM